LRRQRRGDRPQLRLHGVEKPQLPQERLQTLRPCLQHQLGRADVGRVNKDLGDRQRPAERMQIPDGEAAGSSGSRTSGLFRAWQCLVERHGNGDCLKTDPS
jgi:hypothetical protein